MFFMLEASNVLMALFALFCILHGVLMLLTEHVPRQWVRAVLRASDAAWCVAAAAALGAAVVLVQVGSEVLR